MCIRAIRPDDKARLQAGFRRLSPQTIYRRFLQPLTTLTENDLRYLTELDFVNHVGLVVTVAESASEEIIAVGRFVRDIANIDRAEIAFIVADEYQHHGAATLLMGHLTSVARDLGLHTFVGIVQPDNRQMLELFEGTGLPHQARLEDELLHVVMELR